jgi:predicted dinucleotide-binding enzyme
MKVGFLGAGKVAQALGARLITRGHLVSYGVRSPADGKHDALRAGAAVVDLSQVVQASELVVLATPWSGTQAALQAAGDFGGRPLLDATNPLGPGYAFLLGHTDSAGEQVQRWAPSAKVVKAFNTVGTEVLSDPAFGSARAAMFLCGDDGAATAAAQQLALGLGFEAVVVGGLSRARVLEPVARLWIELALVQKQGRQLALGLLKEGAAAHAPVRSKTPREVTLVGSGNIGEGLARAWAKAGHRVTFAARDPAAAELTALCAELGARALPVAQALREASTVVLALPFAALDGLAPLVERWEGKLVIDCTNAVERGMTLKFGHSTSAAEELAKKLPGARVFKSFNAQGAENLALPRYGAVAAANFFCGDDAEGKAVVRGLVEDVGFSAVDAGGLASARLLEPLMLLWVTAAQALHTRTLGFALLRR